MLELFLAFPRCHLEPHHKLRDSSWRCTSTSGSLDLSRFGNFTFMLYREWMWLVWKDRPAGSHYYSGETHTTVVTKNSGILSWFAAICTKGDNFCDFHFAAGLGGSVGCAVRLETRRSRVQPLPRSATFFSWILIVKYFLRSFSPFRWFKKGSYQFLAKECAQYWLTA